MTQLRPRLTSDLMSPWVATTRLSLVATMTLQPVPQKRQGALFQFELARVAVGDEIGGQRRHRHSAGGGGDGGGFQLQHLAAVELGLGHDWSPGAASVDVDGVKDERGGMNVGQQRDGVERRAERAGIGRIDHDDELAFGIAADKSRIPEARGCAASTASSCSGRACTRMLAISPPGGATTRSAVSTRPVISVRRSIAVLRMMASLPVSAAAADRAGPPPSDRSRPRSPYEPTVATASPGIRTAVRNRNAKISMRRGAAVHSRRRLRPT